MPPPPEEKSAPPLRSVTLPKGFRAAGGTCGIKESGKPDLTLIAAERTCAAAAVFTTNAFKGAPVLVGMKHLQRSAGHARAIVANSGNANVATLAAGGEDHAIAMCRAAAEAVGCEPHEVLPASTGVIGRPLPIDRITQGIRDLGPKLSVGPEADAAAAAGILTTDLVTKSAVVERDGYTLGGIAKGSGMIAPSMATMLVFITTDAELSPADLQHALNLANVASFSRMSVDTDTSTSDTVYLLASGSSDHPPIVRDSDAFREFVAALTELCTDLADQIVRDGEGATRTFAVHVRGAASVEDADRIGRAVVDSPLVKCAIHGKDPNWGRLVMAAGKSGAQIDPDRFTAKIQGVTVFADRQPTVTEPDALAALSATMDADRITIELDAHQGEAEATWLGCDLSRQYVAINADYTT
ncbi:MAG: bifunctional glutamate N-acetyltransferase/amino-acid acetyltransferase ArgJ [Planctomycetota bacterium]